MRGPGTVWLFDLDNTRNFFWFVMGGLLLTLAVLGLVLRSRFGHALVGIKHNEQRMRATGYATLLYKLGSFVLGGMLAGLGGFFYAAQYGFVTPEILSWHHSGNALVMIILLLGGFVILSVALLPQGLAGAWSQWRHRHRAVIPSAVGEAEGAGPASTARGAKA